MIDTWFGPYRIEALLGRGGMGEVYRARDTTQGGRVVALKLLPVGLAEDREFLARFRREAEIAARLAEPHVVPIHRFGAIEGRPFIDMQLVEGRELGAVVAEDGPLDPERAVRIVEQIASALDAAHGGGLVHRDVKPSNILVTAAQQARTEFVYLIDFGIARAVEPGSRTALTRTGAVVGTLAYMAPERFLGQGPAPAADIYALACVLHEILTGARPFPGTGFGPQVMGHLEKRPPRPSAQRPSVPPALDAVVARGMAKDPADRHRSAGGLAVHARHALTDPGMPDLPDTVAPAWSPPPVATLRRRRGRVPLAVAVVLTLGLGAAAVHGMPAPPAVVERPSAALLTERAFPGVRSFTGEVRTADVGGVPVLVDSASGRVELIDLATGATIGRPVLDDETSADSAAELDGRTVVVLAGGATNTVRAVDVVTGQPLPLSIPLTGRVFGEISTARTPQGGQLVLVPLDDGTVRRFDLTTGAELVPALPVGLRSSTARLAVIDDRSVVASVDGTDGSATMLRLWDAVTGAELAAVDSPFLDVTPGTYDGQPALFAVSVEENRYAVYGLPVLDMLATDTFPDPFAPATGFVTVAGRPLLASATGPDIELTDLVTGAVVADLFVGHEANVRDLVELVVGERTYLLSSAGDNSVRLWDLTARLAR